MAEQYPEHEKEKRDEGHQSFFWPILLIGLGIIWLLGNLGIINSFDWDILFQLWPIALIIVGLEMLFGKRSPVIGAVIAVVTLLAVIFLVLGGGSQLGLSSNVQRETTNITEERDEASTYRVRIVAGVDDVDVNALINSENLLEAVIEHYAELEYDVQGDANKSILIRQQDQGLDTTGPISSNGVTWDIDLNPDLPLDLTVSGGVGSFDLNLEQFYLSALGANLGTGDISLRLPEARESYNVTIQGGVGDTTLTLPTETAVRIEANAGVGNVSMPSRLERIEGGDDFVSTNGIWQTADYESAQTRILITFSSGVGSLTVR